MRVYLVGADFEENLGLGILAAVTEQAGHEPAIVPFNSPSEMDARVRRVVADDPDVVGLSIQFQHRAHEFLAFARRLRAAGYRGHVTSGGQFPTLAFREVLEGDHGVDSVVLYDGEQTLVELLSALGEGRRLGEVAGLALLGDDGLAFRTEGRALPEDLDAIPFPRRYREHARHMGVPFVPILGGRGCWGKCSYCSITSFYRDAKEQAGGRLMRMRSPENVAAEMAALWHREGGPCIFCFHDDNFTLPNPERTLERMRAIREALDRRGVGRIGIVGKARPDTLTPELAQGLAELGVVRLYVGVENGSAEGGDNLRRGTQQKHVRQALAACREAGIFNCYNLLIFEPHATLDHVRDNVAFIRDHAAHPVNFCRAEPYFGTPLHLELRELQDLGGSYLGWNYRIEDPAAELLFRVCAAAFRERNFAPDGVANRYMGLGYAGTVLRRFYGDGGADALAREARGLTRRISLDTASHLEAAVRLVERVGTEDRDRLERETALLGLEIAAADREWHREIDGLYADMNRFVERHAERREEKPRRPLGGLAKGIAIGASVAALGAGCGDDGTVVDPAPMDAGMVVDPAPGDAGVDAGMVVDPAPGDAGRPDAGVDSGMVVDPPPPDAGVDAGMVVDPAPEDAGMAAASSAADDRRLAVAESKRLRLIDQWRDSAPRRAVRTDDLALFDPPAPRLRAERDGDTVRVFVEGVDRDRVTTRWESAGELEGDGVEARWRPSGDADHVRVAVRARGGVAVVTLRAKSLPSEVG